jgi:hypothetical protein
MCDDALESDDLIECAHCEGLFLSEDMNGEHCRECASELFGDD